MTRETQLHVLVQDHELRLLDDAHVSIEALEDGSARDLEHDPRSSRYVARDLNTGAYRLKAGSEAFPARDRHIEIHPGENRLVMTLGPDDAPFYVADGDRVFFRPDEDRRMVLYVHGPAAVRLVPQLLDGFELTPADPPQDGPGDEAKYFVALPEDPQERQEVADAIRDRVDREFAELGLTAHLAVPVFRGPLERETMEGLTAEFVVRFTGDTEKADVESLAKEFNCEVLRVVVYAGNAFLWRYHGPLDEVLNVIAQVQALPNVVYAEPNVILPIELDAFTPNDYLYPEQPHLPLTGADDAWDVLDDVAVNLRAGSPNVCVAVFDSKGVDPTHPDLTGNLTDGNPKLHRNFNFVTMTNQTFAGLSGDHGTECASSAVGRVHSTAGGAGVAGNCRLIGARNPSDWDGLAMADAWIWAAGLDTGNTSTSFPAKPTQPADVISNSWGVKNGALNGFIKDALKAVTVYGRSGRGCVVCFSIGNLGYVQFTTVRQYAAYERTIAVGATINSSPTTPTSSIHSDPAGNTNNLPAVVDTRAYYSPYGPEVDLVAPSHTSYQAGTGNKVDGIVAAVRTNMGSWPGTAASSTTLVSAVAAGSTTLTVSSTAGFSSGEFVALRAPGDTDFETVAVTNVAGNTLTVGALANAHPTGTVVATGPNDYDSDFGGTSHSCPTVAGAAALLLSMRPALTWVQVREILRTTADEIDFAQANAIGQWVDNDGDGVNEFSQWYGHGRLNIDEAVRSARDDYAPSAVPDVVIRDNLNDVGDVPSPGWHAHSPDIWVRKTDDPIPTLAYGAAPPHENPRRGQDNYVYLRVRNRGAAATNEVYLRAMIAHFPGFEFRYPQEWQPSPRPGGAIPSPLERGTYLIGEVRIDGLDAGANTIVKMTWPEALVPPETVTVSGITTTWHPCVLAEVSPHDGPDPAGATGYPVRHDNNLAHRNIAVDEALGDSFAAAAIAGTREKVGVEAVILDGTLVSEGMRLFARIDDEETMATWLARAEAGEIKTTEPLPRATDEWRDQADLPGDPVRQPDLGRPARLAAEDVGLRVRLPEATSLEVFLDRGPGLLITLPGAAEIGPLVRDARVTTTPTVYIDNFQGQDVVAFEGGAGAISLPVRLRAGQYVPVVLGISRQGVRRPALLQASQRLGDGNVSPGYSVRI